MMEAVKKELGS